MDSKTFFFCIFVIQKNLKKKICMKKFSFFQNYYK
jgi:hypothetical protein